MDPVQPLVISLTGEWDVYRRDELRAVLRSAYDEAIVILDLSGVMYADSTVLGQLVVMRKYRAEKALRPVVLVPSRQIEHILAITQMDELWPCYPSVTAALASADSLPLAEQG